MKRIWGQARGKVDAEGSCRVCGSSQWLETAHTISRIYDPEDGVVRPVDVVPLCRDCHGDYDARKLDLLPYLDHAEQAAGVEHVGIVAAHRRFTSQRDGV